MSILSSAAEQRYGAQKSGILTVIDIGSSKISCLIARLVPLQRTLHLPWRTHRIQVLGFATRQSKGIRAGLVVDISAAEKVVRRVVSAAEEMAKLRVSSVIVNFSGRYLKSERITAEVDLTDERVRESDMRQVVAAACAARQATKKPVIHTLPLSFSLDGDKNLEDPRDMMGNRLGIDLHCLAVDAMAARNLEYCLNRAYLKVEALVAAPYATALSTLLREEVMFGATCIDFGGGTTSFSVFQKGKFVHADCIPIGGQHITADIAQGFSISMEDAERLKIMHGSAADYECGEEQYVSTSASGYGGQKFSRKELARIIRARVEEIAELLNERISKAGFTPTPGHRLVLAGGGSMLSGLPDIMQNVTNVRPRLGRPLGVSGLASSARGGAYSVLAGLSVYPQSMGFTGQEFEQLATQHRSTTKIKNVGARFLQSVNGYVKVFKGF